MDEKSGGGAKRRRELLNGSRSGSAIHEHGSYGGSAPPPPPPPSPPQPPSVHGSPSVEVLNSSFRRMMHASPSVEREASFEDTSESMGKIYFRLMTGYRVNITLYNAEHKEKFKPRSPQSDSRRTSPVRSSPLLQHQMALRQSQQQHQHSSTPSSPAARLSMSVSEMRTSLLPGLVHHSASSENIHMSDSESSSAAESSRHASAGGGVNGHGKMMIATLWDLAQMRCQAQEPKLALGEVVGLERARKQLAAMMLQYSDRRFRSVFVKGTPPERTLYVRSETGSGVHTLVNGVCKQAGVNIIRLNYGVEPHWSDKLFVELLDFAMAIQPVLVFFDRCENWFMMEGGGYNARGDRFIQALQSHEEISSGEAHIMFVVSSSKPLGALAEPVKNWIKPFREVTHHGMERHEAVRCLEQALVGYVNDLEKAVIESVANQRAQEYGGVFDAIHDEAAPVSVSSAVAASAFPAPEYESGFFNDVRRQVKGSAEQFGERLVTYTPAMIKQVVNKAVDLARTRMLEEAQASGKECDLHFVIPLAYDIDCALNATVVEPGSLKWKASIKGHEL